MKVAVLTSSRADYGIYLPLLRAMQADPFFDVSLIAFGTHLSRLHGYTVDAIRHDGFMIDHIVENVLPNDSPADISASMALAGSGFSGVWDKAHDQYDLVLCLGDRYEMFSAVSAGVPYNIRFAHIHGGETTLGAIDNKFRDCLTIFSALHFTSTEAHAKRVAQIRGNDHGVFTVGALSLDNLETVSLLSADDFQRKYNIDMRRPTILVTFHPETEAPATNEKNAQELVNALAAFDGRQIIITMPNADTFSNAMRNVYHQFAASAGNVVLVENFGTDGYFSCMNLCELVAGNSSSGIIEAASMHKYVVDIGDRQKGRSVSMNVIHSAANAAAIIDAIKLALSYGPFTGDNIYFRNGAARSIVNILKNENTGSV